MISLGANTFSLATPVWVVGTYNPDGKPNVMTAAWAGICCSKPPCVYVSTRKATQTYKNLMERKAFTVNFPSEEYVKEADYFGIVSGKETDKLSTTNLAAIRSDLVDAPYVQGFPMILECKVIKEVELGLHTMSIGEIMDVKVHETMLDENKQPDVNKLKTFIWSSVDMHYHKTGEVLAKSFTVGKQVGERKANIKENTT